MEKSKRELTFVAKTFLTVLRNRFKIHQLQELAKAMELPDDDMLVLICGKLTEQNYDPFNVSK